MLSALALGAISGFAWLASQPLGTETPSQCGRSLRQPRIDQREGREPGSEGLGDKPASRFDGYCELSEAN